MFILRIISSIILIFGITLTESAAEDFKCNLSLHGDETYKTPEIRFSPYDAIYLQTICQDLQPDTYEMNAVWYNPSQQIQRQDTHTFHLQNKTNYTAFFWMKLHKKTSIREALSNRSFSTKQYGNWNIKLYLNNQKIGTKSFSIQ